MGLELIILSVLPYTASFAVNTDCLTEKTNNKCSNTDQLWALGIDLW